MRSWFLPFALVYSLLCAAQDAPVPSDLPARTDYQIRYVNGKDVYVNGGRGAGLAAGMDLVVKLSPKEKNGGLSERAISPGILARLKVVAVASDSAVCEVTVSSRPLVPGDVVSLPAEEIKKMVQERALGKTREYPMIISFTQGDPLDDEIRDELPHPPLPEVNEARGRIGFDFSTIRTPGPSGLASTMYGMVARADISRIWGTHWNLNGYWRGQLESSSATSQQSIQDLINRTYQMSLTWLNPDSKWTAGVGRLYLPWASSLEVIDGGYVGRQLTRGTIAGVFGGSTPDPTAWNYNPDRRIGGGFFNFHGGDFDRIRYSSSVGGGVNLIKWNIDRPFIFTENEFSWKRYISVYHAMEVDKPSANPSTPVVSWGLGQSFLSVQLRVTPRATIEMNDTYLRDVPTFDAALVGTGLLDQYLFQGFTTGARVQVPLNLTAYFSGGRSSTSTDAQKSWNLQGGLTESRLWRTGLQVDARYSEFNSSFASGIYRTLTLSRPLGERLQLNLQGGKQSFTSSLTTNNSSWFANAYCDVDFGAHYFFETGYTTQRGGTDDYDQWTGTVGWRFDNRAAKRRAAHALHH